MPGRLDVAVAELETDTIRKAPSPPALGSRAGAGAGSALLKLLTEGEGKTEAAVNGVTKDAAEKGAALLRHLKGEVDDTDLVEEDYGAKKASGTLLGWLHGGTEAEIEAEAEAEAHWQQSAEAQWQQHEREGELHAGRPWEDRCWFSDGGKGADYRYRLQGLEEESGILEAQMHTDGRYYIFAEGKWHPAQGRYFCSFCDVFGNTLQAHLAGNVHKNNRSRWQRFPGPSAGGPAAWDAGGWEEEWPSWEHGQGHLNWRESAGAQGSRSRPVGRPRGSAADWEESGWQESWAGPQGWNPRSTAQRVEKEKGKGKGKGKQTKSDQGGWQRDQEDSEYREYREDREKGNTNNKRWKEETWQPVRVAKEKVATGDAAAGNPPKAPKVRAPWKAVWSKENQSHYYWNTSTGIVSWYGPDENEEDKSEEEGKPEEGKPEEGKTEAPVAEEEVLAPKEEVLQDAPAIKMQ